MRRPALAIGTTSIVFWAGLSGGLLAKDQSSQPPAATVIEERIDIYDPRSGAYLGSETTNYAPDGRRLRQVNTDKDGVSQLTFLIVHDERGREGSALYFEDDASQPSREEFAYSEDGRQKEVVYFQESGEPGEKTQIGLDRQGREKTKRYFRADGSQYGEESVLWTTDGNKLGWDFRYVGRSGGASFRYSYSSVAEDGQWRVRSRLRDGNAERIEARTLTKGAGEIALATAIPFALGAVSTNANETSPSMTDDGRTLVFARYGEEWSEKRPYMARLGEDGWEVERLEELGTVYNLAISGDGGSIVTSSANDGALKLYKLDQGQWQLSVDLSERFEITGSYPQLTAEGRLIYYDTDGTQGAGLYRIADIEDTQARPQRLHGSGQAVAFDPYLARSGSLFFTQCSTDSCARSQGNGVFVLREMGAQPELLKTMNYVWGFQISEPLGLVLHTDGEDILALPIKTALKHVE